MEIAIIGAGFAGIACAVGLISRGNHSVWLFEEGPGFGGTWMHNTYPGAEVDTPSLIYSFSFAPEPWSRTHVRQAELRDYLERVANKHSLGPRTRFNTRIASVDWREDTQDYLLHASDGTEFRADVVVSAVGLLSDPKLPSWPGMKDFEGPLFHAARWDHTADLTGRRVAIVGTGSSAAQLVPALSSVAEHVTLFQREPGWVIPKLSREYSPAERDALAVPRANRVARLNMLWNREKGQRGGRVMRPGSPQHTAAQAAARRFIDTTLAGRTDLIEAVTPQYPFGGKRTIISDDYYPSLLRDNVTLVPAAVDRVTAKGLVDSRGDRHHADAIVLATGFSTHFLPTFEVTGRDGRSLRQFWNGDDRAFLGLMVPGFPNFFMMYGPNTNGGAIVSNLELQADYIVAAVNRLARGRRRGTIEVSQRAFEWMDRWQQRKFEGTAYHLANNYYRSASGRVTTQWTGGMYSYAMLTKLMRGPFWRVTRAPRTRQAPVMPAIRTLLSVRTSTIMKPADQ
ncbi:MAG: NAD(P)/FAD-dependent oxidoreductase [Actinomycetota bacterium]